MWMLSSQDNFSSSATFFITSFFCIVPCPATVPAFLCLPLQAKAKLHKSHANSFYHEALVKVESPCSSMLFSSKMHLSIYHNYSLPLHLHCAQTSAMLDRQQLEVVSLLVEPTWLPGTYQEVGLH